MIAKMIKSFDGFKFTIDFIQIVEYNILAYCVLYKYTIIFNGRGYIWQTAKSMQRENLCGRGAAS